MEKDSVGQHLEHPVFGKLVLRFTSIVALCVEKCNVEKSFDLKFIQDASRRVLSAIESDSKKAVDNGRSLSLLTYVVEISWSFLYRTVEICGHENILVCGLRDDLILLQRSSTQLPVTKGLEVSTRCLILAHRATKLNEARDFAVSWSSYFDDLFAADDLGGKSLSVAEMQRVILFYCECSSHSAALCISDDKISANWMRLRPLTVANGTSGHSWFVIRLIVNMEIKIRGHSGYPSPKTVKKTGKFKVIKCSDSAEYDMDIVNMAAVLESIEWEDIDANDLELLSRALILALRIEIVCHEGDSATGNNVSHGRNRVTSERSSAALLERVSTQCQRVCDTSKQDSSRHPLFVARTYSSCLNWLQKHFQNNKEVQLPALEPQLIPVIVAGEVITIVLQSLSACTMWGHTGSSILAVLRALGNCLSHVPVQCFEGQLGAALCSALGSCVCSLQAGLYPENSALSGRDYKVSPEHSKDILNTCYTLASLVSGKCLGRKLFASAASLAASTLLAASRAATASAVEETTGSMCGSPPPTADFTAESATLNRILSNLVTACSLGYCDVADLDAHHRPLSERGNIVSSTDAAEEQVEDREGGYTTIIEACSAIFKSTYAEEFLYSVCADVQLRVCNTRPSHLPSVVDIGTAEAAIRFLGLLQKAAEVHNTAIEGENVLVLIHFRSHCLWSAVTVPGASDAAAASVIESLKAIGEGIDPLVMDSIAAVRGKSKAKKPVRGEKVPKSALLPRGTSPEESLRSLSCHLRAWMLLAMWGLPISAAQGDAYASDGTHGVSVYLSNACRALKTISETLEQQRKQGVDMGSTPLSALYTLSADSKALYHMLGLSGRSREQVEVSLHFQACSSLFTGCTGGARPQILKKEYAHAVEEVVCLGRMQSAWSGDSSPGCGAKVTGQTVRASSGRGYDTADDQTDSGSITLRRFIEISGRLLLAASTGVEESYHAPSAAAHTERKKDKSATVAPCSIAEFESHAETILFLSPSPSAAQSQKHQPVPYALSPALKAWVALLAAKTSLCAYREHQRAYKWVRRALSYVVLRSSDSPKLGGMGGEGASCVAIDRCLPRLEGILLSAELYEQTGSTNSCLSYLVEATAIANTSSSALRNIVTLHSMRIWQRMQSARFVSALLDLGDGCSGDEFTVLASRDDVSKQVRAASRALSRLLKTDDADDDGDSGGHDDDRRAAPSDAVGVPSYRHISCSWDFGPSLPSLAASSKCYHTNVGRGDRMFLAAVAADCAASFSEEPSGRDKAPSVRPSFEQLLETFRCSKSFDLVRDVRRMGCLLSLKTRASSTPVEDSPCPHRASESFISFVLGASSCGTALECVMDRSGGSTSPATSTGLSAVSNDIASACCNDSQALLRLENTLRSHLQSSASGMDAVCFLAIEPCTKNLLVGRWDRAGCAVVALPVAAELGCLLAQWGACMESSKALLHRTLDSALVAKWTEVDKREWWAERAASDALLGNLLGKLEAMLGQWSSLLVGSNGKEEIPVASSSDDTTSGASADSIYAERTVDIDLDSDLDDHLLKALSALKVTELRQQLKEKSLSVVGKKSELISRLQSHRCAPRTCNQSPKICLYEDPRDVMVRSAGEDPSSHSAELIGLATRPVAVEAKGRSKSSKLGALSSGASTPVSLDASQSDVKTASSSSVASAHTVLILDEVLQQIPWEVLPALRGLRCSRVPSLALLAHMLTRRESDPKGREEGVIDGVSSDECKGESAVIYTSSSTEQRVTEPPGSTSSSIIEPPSAPLRALGRGANMETLRHTWFAVDPEGNLPATRDTMAAFLSPYRQKYGWTGFIGSMPSEQAAKDLHHQSDLFVYCGHGAGEKICDSYKMRRWQCPSAMLWGCSSGRLTAQGVHDPQGVALNYLIGGADYVVANLWDVTDKDIDKLSMECMRTFFDSQSDNGISCAVGDGEGDSICGASSRLHSSATLCGALASSRAVCKLKNAVGCAPVVYGLPKIESTRKPEIK